MPPREPGSFAGETWKLSIGKGLAKKKKLSEKKKGLATCYVLLGMIPRESLMRL